MSNGDGTMLFSKKMAERLMEFFGGEETIAAIEYLEDGHSGAGYYVYCHEYPEEGACFLGTMEDTLEE